MTDPRIAFFDNLATGWDKEEPLPRTMADRLELLHEILGFTEGMDLLEVGCGTGKLTGWLVEQVAPGRVTGVDFAPEMIRQAKGKDINATFLCVDVCDEDFGRARPAEYDLVFCFHCFPHFRDQPAALRNLVAAMKPTGRLIVMHLAGSKHINNFHANLEGPVSEDILPVGDEWEPLLQKVGLTPKLHIDRDDLFFMAVCKQS
jgi:ubiquinone/menaquinone biosynthesis C-methylase UbiE